ncbi:hypothetical protein PENSUB_315 [Penicillium subrubescens]|uniref:Uncharacterized protein n=1 Tax=Penicillium subrubescens TaxID=1316194 RepID=A0A1Q5UNK3_9EURO|nr:hypothetical protein PENSUB_315 [Penicillium subrubescens]
MSVRQYWLSRFLQKPGTTELIGVVHQYFPSVLESSTTNTSDANRGYSWEPCSRRRKLEL